MHSRIARPLRLGALAFASALALSACEEQPVGSFKNAEFVNEGSRAKTDLYFQPGGSALRPGEAGRLHSFLSTQLLSPETDILIRVGSTGSPVLDARRRGTLKASMPRTPARVRLVRFDSELGRDLRADLAEVEVVQYDRLEHPLPGQPGGLLRADDAAPEPGLLERDQPRTRGRPDPRPDRPARLPRLGGRHQRRRRRAAPRGQGHHDAARPHHRGQLTPWPSPPPPTA